MNLGRCCSTQHRHQMCLSVTSHCRWVERPTCDHILKTTSGKAFWKEKCVMSTGGEGKGWRAGCHGGVSRLTLCLTSTMVPPVLRGSCPPSMDHSQSTHPTHRGQCMASSLSSSLDSLGSRDDGAVEQLVALGVGKASLQEGGCLGEPRGRVQICRPSNG